MKSLQPAEAIEYARNRKDEWLAEYSQLLQDQEDGRASQFLLSELLDIQKIYEERHVRFLPHPDGDEVDEVVAEWAKKHGLWIGNQGDGIETSAEVNEMNKYLGRFAIDKKRLIVSGKIYIILFYIDDTIAN